MRYRGAGSGLRGRGIDPAATAEIAFGGVGLFAMGESFARVRRLAHAAAGPALACGALLALAQAHGGWFAPAWNWTALVFLFVALAQVLTAPLALSRLELAFVGLLGALTAWTALSTVWSASTSAPIREAERTLVYAAGALAILLLARRSLPSLAGAAGVATTIVAGGALLHRLAPDLVGVGVVAYDHRMTGTIPYSNATGLVAVLGLLLAVGAAATAASPVVRAIAGGAIVVDGSALYFTFSRGSWLALGAGILVAVAASPARLRVVALAVAPGAAVALCGRSRALAVGYPNAALRHDGHRVLALLVLLALVSAAVAVVVVRISPSRRSVRALAATVAVSVVAALAVTGGPVHVARQAYATFAAQPPAALAGTRRPVADPRTRLLDTHGSGRLQLWRAALGEARAHPLGGSGAGTFEDWWNRHRTRAFAVRDAHSLYLETLAELGPPGLLLLAAALALPLVAGVRRRRTPWVPFVLAAYVAYLAHTAIDWDWELPAVTLAGLVCGIALLSAPAAARDPRARVRVALAVPLVVLLAATAVALIGNSAIAAASASASHQRWDEAAPSAQRATAWAPWDADAWRLLAESQFAAGANADGIASLRRALAVDAQNWRLWARLAGATNGRQHDAALARAYVLDPLDVGGAR